MKWYRIIFGVIIGMSLFPSLVHASTVLGTIDPNNTGNYKAIVQNSGIGTATTLNFGKFTTQATKNITISNSMLRGFAWGQGIGWIVLNCLDTTSGCSSINSNFGVRNNGSGLLSGFAWGQTAGWVNFGPFTNPLISRIQITNGALGGTLGSAGYAWAQNFGWIKFDCSSTTSCVQTDWGVVVPTPPPSPSSMITTSGGRLPQCSDAIDNDGNGLVDYPADPGCTSPTDTTEAPITPVDCRATPTDPACNAYSFCTVYPMYPSCVRTIPTASINTPPAICTTTPTDPACNAYSFCTIYPTDVSCKVPTKIKPIKKSPPPVSIPTPVSFCETYPTDASCIVSTPPPALLPPTEPIPTSPIPTEAPVVGAVPSFCMAYPNDPSCIKKSPPKVTPVVASTESPPYCETHPTSVLCTNALIQLMKGLSIEINTGGTLLLKIIVILDVVLLIISTIVSFVTRNTFLTTNVVPNRISRGLFAVGFVLAAGAMIIYPSISNALILAGYLVITMLRVLTPLFGRI